MQSFVEKSVSNTGYLEKNVQIHTHVILLFPLIPQIPVKFMNSLKV